MSSHTIPVRELVRDLSKQFSEATKGLPDAARGNQSYQLQSDFAWYIHEITSGPACMVYEQVNQCKEFIRNIKIKKAA